MAKQHRLTKITTRTGDDGTTGLADGSRLAKDAPRIDALGDVDELNSVIGLVLTESIDDLARNCLQGVQHDLFDLGGDLSIPGRATVTAEQITSLDHYIDEFNANLPPLAEFILPGGSRASALCHVARTVCRRAERSLITLSRRESISTINIQYINRLSDLLFVLARVANQGQPSPMWRGPKPSI